MTRLFAERIDTGSVSDSATLQLTINGAPKTVPAGTTIAKLLELMNIDRAQVAVEVNAHVVRRARHAEHALTDRDEVEIVTFVGGG